MFAAVTDAKFTGTDLLQAQPQLAVPLRLRARLDGGMLRSFLLTLPLTAFLVLFYAYPVGAMLFRSIHPAGWSLAAYAAVAGNAVFWRVMSITLDISVTVTLCCLALAYPLAYWLARLPVARANLLLILVLVPFWTSILVRSYAWMALLERHGIINNLLIWLHIIPQPLRLLNTRFSVYLAMVHAWSVRRKAWAARPGARSGRSCCRCPVRGSRRG
jgi:putative spermidine/putrescine transport system permease protein